MSKAAIGLAQAQLRRKARKQGSQLQPETLIHAESRANIELADVTVK